MFGAKWRTSILWMNLSASANSALAFLQFRSKVSGMNNIPPEFEPEFRDKLPEDIQRRAEVVQSFETCNEAALNDYKGEQAAKYAKLKSRSCVRPLSISQCSQIIKPQMATALAQRLRWKRLSTPLSPPFRCSGWQHVHEISAWVGYRSWIRLQYPQPWICRVTGNLWHTSALAILSRSRPVRNSSGTTGRIDESSKS